MRAGFGEAESLLGEVLAVRPDLRDRMVLATKGGIRPGVPYDWSASYLRTACEDSLRRLGVDVIDLYQLHRPDVLTHPGEVAEVLTELRDRGLVRHLGLSNVTPSQFEMVQAHLDVELVTTQPEFSVWHSDPVRDGTFDQCLTLLGDAARLVAARRWTGRCRPGIRRTWSRRRCNDWRTSTAWTRRRSRSRS